MSKEIAITKTTQAEIEKLVGAPTTLAADIIAEAQAQRDEEARNIAINKAKHDLANVEHYITSAVESLRSARAIARDREQKLAKLLKAKAEFLKDGDYHKFDCARYA